MPEPKKNTKDLPGRQRAFKARKKIQEHKSFAKTDINKFQDFKYLQLDKILSVIYEVFEGLELDFIQTMKVRALYTDSGNPVGFEEIIQSEVWDLKEEIMLYKDERIAPKMPLGKNIMSFTHFGSRESYLRKYGLFMLLGLMPKNEDESESIDHSKVTAAPPKQTTKTVVNAGVVSKNVETEQPVKQELAPQASNVVVSKPITKKPDDGQEMDDIISYMVEKMNCNEVELRNWHAKEKDKVSALELMRKSVNNHKAQESL